MTTTIFKYALNLGRTVLDLPNGAKVLTVQMQQDTPCMWAQVDTEQAKFPHAFNAYATGEVMPDNPGQYVGTFEMNGALVFHLFKAAR